MGIRFVLWDLDGTLLPMNQDVFTKGYFRLLADKMTPCGYEPGRLIDAVWTGTDAMVKNDGKRSNEKVFWDCFAKIYGETALADRHLFEEFYEQEFQDAAVFCKYNPKAAETVREIRRMGLKMALAVNPVFPAAATESRIRWAGLEPEEFELYTAYENIGYCKPNTEYYREILRRLDADPEECLMVGNDVEEDMVAETIGMNVFLLTDCLINKERKDINQYPRGSFEQLVYFIRHNLMAVEGTP